MKPLHYGSFIAATIIVVVVGLAATGFSMAGGPEPAEPRNTVSRPPRSHSRFR